MHLSKKHCKSVNIEMIPNNLPLLQVTMGYFGDGRSCHLPHLRRDLVHRGGICLFCTVNWSMYGIHCLLFTINVCNFVLFYMLTLFLKLFLQYKNSYSLKYKKNIYIGI